MVLDHADYQPCGEKSEEFVSDGSGNEVLVKPHARNASQISQFVALWLNSCGTWPSRSLMYSPKNIPPNMQSNWDALMKR